MSFDSLPSIVILEVASALNPRALGRLLQTRKGILPSAETERAWKQIAGPRGVLVDYTNQQLAVVHDRVRSLLPSSMDEFKEGTSPSLPREDRSLDEFAFTWSIFWQDGEKLTSAMFEHVRYRSYDGPDPPPELYDDQTGFAFPIPGDAEGHAALTPHLKRSQDHAHPAASPYHSHGNAEEREAYRLYCRFCNDWNVGAMLLCTRKRDGVTVQLARLDQGLCEKEPVNGAVDQPGPFGSLNFYGGYNGGRPLDVGFHTYSGLEYIDCNIVNLVFDKSTGKLRYVTGHFCRGEEMDDVSDEYFRTYLHAKCDYMSRQTLVPAKWSMQENRYVPSSP